MDLRRYLVARVTEVTAWQPVAIVAWYKQHTRLATQLPQVH